MDFGDWNRFGIEACADHYLAHAPHPLKSVCGRVRVWLHGEPIGSLDEWGVALGVVETNLRHALRDDRRAWHPCMASLQPADQYHLADAVIFGVELPPGRDRLATLTRNPEVQDGLDEGYCLMHSTESFDGWKVIMLREPGSRDLLWRWTARDRATVTSCSTTVEEVEAALAPFVAWLTEAQAAWTARSES